MAGVASRLDDDSRDAADNKVPEAGQELDHLARFGEGSRRAGIRWLGRSPALPESRNPVYGAVGHNACAAKAARDVSTTSQRLDPAAIPTNRRSKPLVQSVDHGASGCSRPWLDEFDSNPFCGPVVVALGK
jgi:hypothetical protein